MLPDGRSFYEFLEIAPNASNDVILAAVRTLWKKYHPDRGGSHDEGCWINEAKTTLLDPVKREAYDRELIARGKLNGAETVGAAEPPKQAAGDSSYNDPFHWQQQAAQEAVRLQALEREKRRRQAEEQERRRARAEREAAREREEAAEKLRRQREEREKEANRQAAAEAKLRRTLEEERVRLEMLHQRDREAQTTIARGKAMINGSLVSLLLSGILLLLLLAPDVAAINDNLLREQLLAGATGLVALVNTILLLFGLSQVSSGHKLEKELADEAVKRTKTGT